MDLSERPREASGPKQRHPWERSRYRFFESVLLEGDVRPTRVLDAGAGDGWFSQQLLRVLPPTARVTCFDAYYEPALMKEFAAQAGERVTFTREPPTERFELIMLLDVLEHVEHDRDFLGRLVRDNLADAGSVLISVPAWPQLFTKHDTLLRHHRRYLPSQARALIEQSGLKVAFGGGLFHGLILPRAVEKARELIAPSKREQPLSLDWSAGEVLTRAVDLALTAENKLSLFSAKAGLELPGLSWWALCKKR
jgi:2-polyprenyl-3-methyl-5-hydroxy-6-metoxy-1,4-benzoquinol methylase